MSCSIKATNMDKVKLAAAVIRWSLRAMAIASFSFELIVANDHKLINLAAVCATVAECLHL